MGNKYEIDSSDELIEEVVDECGIEEEYDASLAKNHKEDNKSILIEKSLYLNVSLDTEYSDYAPITLQFTVEGFFQNINIDFAVIIVEEKLEQKVPKDIIEKFIFENNCTIAFENLTKENHEAYIPIYIKYILKKKYNIIFEEETKIIVNLYLFYSIKDLTIAFSEDIMLLYYLNKRKGISQTRRIHGKIELKDFTLNTTTNFVFKINDLYGLETGGLKAMAESCGILVDEKTSLDNYKTNMHLALKEVPYTFFTYCLNDCYLLLKILDSKINTYNDILINILKITDSKALFSRQTIPLTVGSIVNLIWTKFFQYKIFKNNSVLILACTKQCILNNLSPNYSINKEIFNIISNISNLKQLEEFLTKTNNTQTSNNKPINSYENIQNYLKKSSIEYKFYQFASSKYLIESSFNSTHTYLSLVAGGRTINERPLEFEIFNGGDIDISRAYAEVMKSLTFPIGRPRILGFSNNDYKKINLGRFMEKYEDSFSGNLYKIIVSGKISFEQDLILSKAITYATLEKRKKVFKPDQANTFRMTADLTLLRKEIINGVITKPIWDILKKVCNNQEFGQIKNLEVQSAMYWQEKDRVDTIEELSKHYVSTPSSYTSGFHLKSNENFKWLGVPMKDLIEPLIETRKKYKNQKDVFSKAIQNSIKTVINTSYGVIASSYFEINNTCITDIITSSVRCQVWLMAKAFNLNLTITDGGPYSFQSVSFLTGKKKPGLDTLSSYYKYSKNSNISLGSLGGINWEIIFLTNINISQTYNLDALAKEHLIKFWSKYNIEINFDIEHKPENIYKKGAYIGKSFYAFLNYNALTGIYDQPMYKIRGVSLNLLDQGITISPIYYLLEFILFNDMDINDKFVVPNEGFYKTLKLLKLPEYRRSLTKNSKGMIVSPAFENNLPGDSILLIREFRLNNTYFFIDYYETYSKRNHRTLRRDNYGKDSSGNLMKRVPFLFEKYLPTLGIKKTIQLMAEDKLRSNYNKKKNKKN